MGIAVLSAPLAAEAQQAGKTYRIGWLGNTPPGDPATIAIFQQSLRDFGWVEGQNIVFERRYWEGRTERLPSLAAELVRLKPDLIITTGGTPSAAAAKQATTTIPIVFCYVGDPVASGFVASLSRPGGNLTGLGATGAGIHAKLLEFMKEALPRDLHSRRLCQLDLLVAHQRHAARSRGRCAEPPSHVEKHRGSESTRSRWRF